MKGNVWVFSKYNQVDFYDLKSSNYCDREVYLFAFWTMIVAYIMLGLALILGICGLCIALICCGFAFGRK
jgi:hypothetical protein